MAYTPRDWTNVPLNETPPDGAPALDAANLSRIEGGISAAHDEIDGRLSEASLSGTFVSSADYPGLTVDTSVGTRVMVGGVMIHGDTGWRAVDWMPAGHSWSIQWARRVGNQVRLRVEGTISESGSSSAPAAVAAGFRIAGAYGAHFPALIDGTTVYAFQTNAAGSTYLTGGPLPPGVMRSEFAWTTNQAWPSSLPGTPA